MYTGLVRNPAVALPAADVGLLGLWRWVLIGTGTPGATENGGFNGRDKIAQGRLGQTLQIRSGYGQTSQEISLHLPPILSRSTGQTPGSRQSSSYASLYQAVA